MIHLALAGETLPIYGDGRQRRDYIYIDDAVDALLRLGESNAGAGRTYNVGSGTGISTSGSVASASAPSTRRSIVHASCLIRISA